MAVTPRLLGVIGRGFVGAAACLLENPSLRVISYDLRPEACSPPGTTLKDVAQADAVMIAVPTPMDPTTGAADTSFVEKVVAGLREHRSECLILVRSTVPPGTCERLGVCFMPEFLTEATPEADFRATREWIIGVPEEMPECVVGHVAQIFGSACDHGCIQSSRMAWTTATEAELIKYFRNTFLATKVSFCNEFAALCGRLGVSYDTVRQHAASDPRIALSHTQVPGPDGKRGFGGTCFPKDVHALRSAARSIGGPCPVLDAVAARNERIDRPGKDWLQDVGRAVAATTRDTRD
tara:strand:- start:1679 stop:2560 length:882 start_codon:yes stop_codon:yes gene_type:complete